MAAQVTAGTWSAQILELQGVKWTNSEVTLLERALQGTAEEYRKDVLLSLINAGYRPSEETFFIVALFGKIKELSQEIPTELDGATAEFKNYVETMVHTIAEQKERFDTFHLTINRVIDGITERIKEQSASLATKLVADAVSAKEVELRRNITATINDEVRKALVAALDDNKDTLERIKENLKGSNVVEAVTTKTKTVRVPVPVKFVAKGGLTVNGKSFVPVALAAAISLFAGVQFGHLFPRPEVANAAAYGQAVRADRHVMPSDVRSWLDVHIARPR